MSGQRQDARRPQDDQSWRYEAACRGAPQPAVFHIAKNSVLVEKVIKYYCDRCPVTAACLDEAMRFPPGERRGIWGGHHFGGGYA